jgi:hypothetical protein
VSRTLDIGRPALTTRAGKAHFTVEALVGPGAGDQTPQRTAGHNGRQARVLVAINAYVRNVGTGSARLTMQNFGASCSLRDGKQVTTTRRPPAAAALGRRTLCRRDSRVVRSTVESTHGPRIYIRCRNHNCYYHSGPPQCDCPARPKTPEQQQSHTRSAKPQGVVATL